ncbi:hypothetical protein AB7M35_004473 [Amorphus suaedae]|jgi:hypothetical protein
MSVYVVNAVRHDSEGQPSAVLLRARIEAQSDGVAVNQARAYSNDYWNIGGGGYAWLSDADGATIWSFKV